MPAIVPAIAAELANGVSDVLEQAGKVLTGNQADYIKNGDPQSIYGKVQQETARRACRRYADDPGQFSGRAAVLVENACRPYLDDVGYGGQPTIKLPFRDGQCTGVNYTVSITSTVFPFSDCSNFGPSTSVNGFSGPIRGLRFAVVNPSGQLCTPGRNIAYLQHGPPGNETVVAGGGFGVNAVINSVVPEIPSLPSCGNPLPEIEPGPAPVTPDPPGPRPFNPSPDINIDIDVTVNPDLSFDVDFGTGPITIDPFGDGGGGGDPGGGGGDPGDPTDPGSPGAGGSTGAGGAADGEAPEGEELVGLLVTVTEAPGDANRFDNNTAQPFRGIGYVRMGYPGRLGLDISGGTVISPQFFHAQQRGLTNWAVAANIGFNLTIVPYYRSIES